MSTGKGTPKKSSTTSSSKASTPSSSTGKEKKPAASPKARTPKSPIASRKSKSTAVESPVPSTVATENELPSKSDAWLAWSRTPKFLGGPSCSAVGTYSSSGEQYFTATESKVHIYHTTTGERLGIWHSYSDSPIIHISLNPFNSFQLYVVYWDGRVEIKDTMDGTVLDEYQFRAVDGGGVRVRGFACSARHTHRVHVSLERRGGESRRLRCPTVDVNFGDHSHVVAAVDLQQNEILRVLERSSEPIQLLESHPSADVDLVAVGVGASGHGPRGSGAAFELRLYNDRGTLRGHITSKSRLTAVRFHPLLPQIVLADLAGRFSLASIPPAHAADEAFTIPSHEMREYHWHSHAFRAMNFTVDGAYLLTGGSESVLVVWHLESSGRDYLPRLGAPVTAVHVAPGGRQWAVVTADNAIRFVDASSRAVGTVVRGIKPVAVPRTEAPRSLWAPFGLAVEPLQHKLVLSGVSGQLQLFHPTLGRHLEDIPVCLHNSANALHSSVQKHHFWMDSATMNNTHNKMPSLEFVSDASSSSSSSTTTTGRGNGNRVLLKEEEEDAPMEEEDSSSLSHPANASKKGGRESSSSSSSLSSSSMSGQQVVIRMVSFTSCGQWMLTVHKQRAGRQGGEASVLKFWARSPGTDRFVEAARVDRPHERYDVAALAMHPFKPLAATVADDGLLRFWTPSASGASSSLEDGGGWTSPSAILVPGEKPLRDVAFSEDGSLLAVAVGGEVALWNVAEACWTCSLAAPAPVERVLFMGASPYLATACTGCLVMWDLRCRGLAWMASQLQASALAVLHRPGRRPLLAVSGGKQLALFEVDDPLPRQLWTLPPQGRLQMVALAPLPSSPSSSVSSPDSLLFLTSAGGLYSLEPLSESSAKHAPSSTTTTLTSNHPSPLLEKDGGLPHPATGGEELGHVAAMELEGGPSTVERMFSAETWKPAAAGMTTLADSSKPVRAHALGALNQSALGMPPPARIFPMVLYSILSQSRRAEADARSALAGGPLHTANASLAIPSPAASSATTPSSASSLTASASVDGPADVDSSSLEEDPLASVLLKLEDLNLEEEFDPTGFGSNPLIYSAIHFE